MGFCYPGKGKLGDLPPRKECAPLWHNASINQMKEVKLILLIGQYAQEYYLRDNMKKPSRKLDLLQSEPRPNLKNYFTEFLMRSQMP